MDPVDGLKSLDHNFFMRMVTTLKDNAFTTIFNLITEKILHKVQPKARDTILSRAETTLNEVKSVKDMWNLIGPYIHNRSIKPGISEDFISLIDNIAQDEWQDKDYWIIGCHVLVSDHIEALYEILRNCKGDDFKWKDFEFPWLIQCAQSLGKTVPQDMISECEPALCLLNLSITQIQALIITGYPLNTNPYFQCALLDEIFFHYNVWKSPEALAGEAINKGSNFSRAVDLFLAQEHLVEITDENKVILGNEIRTSIFFQRLRDALGVDLYDFERLRMLLLAAKLSSDNTNPRTHLNGLAKIFFSPGKLRSLINFREKEIRYMGFDPYYIHWICK
jgi:hypothetical protein